jgi:hypothetical protein
MGQVHLDPDLDQLRREGRASLASRLGVEGAIELLQRLVPPSGDYTAQRDDLLAGRDLDTIYREIIQRRGESEPTRGD